MLNCKLSCQHVEQILTSNETVKSTKKCECEYGNILYRRFKEC